MINTWFYNTHCVEISWNNSEAFSTLFDMYLSEIYKISKIYNFRFLVSEKQVHKKKKLKNNPNFAVKGSSFSTLFSALAHLLTYFVPLSVFYTFH